LALRLINIRLIIKPETIFFRQHPILKNLIELRTSDFPKRAIEQEPEVIIIGTGASGVAEVSEEVKKEKISKK